MRTKLLVGLLFAGSSLFAATHVSIGIGGGGYGGYYAAPPVVAYAPPCPGPGYSWVDGYWSSAGPRRSWHSGYWARQAYSNRYRRERRYDSDRYEGYRYNGNYGNGYNGYSDRNRYDGNTYNGNGYDANRNYNGYVRR